MDFDKVTNKQMLWERKLLDFSLRNNLINCKLGKRTIPFISFDIDKLEDNLQSVSDYTIMPIPSVKIEPLTDGMYDSLLQANDLKQEVIKALGQKKIISYLTQTELSNAIKYIYRTSRTALEENGTNSLFLALGLVKWFEDSKNTTPRYAPILLLPVNIIRKNGLQGYAIRLADEEIIFNVTLKELLKQQFHIDLNSLDNLPIDETGIDVKLVFETMQQAISGMNGWKVLPESLLGLFSFNKFVMWNDIHSNKQKLAEHKIISSLIDNKLYIDNTEDFTNARQIDKTKYPKEFAIPLDVDSSQLEAVIESANDKSFVLYGPPGTGKSQTITNMIANALYHGKKVLFVAEKMAALEVVQKRLEKIGIAPFCLELHSNKATKKHFLQQMQQALDVVKINSAEEYKKISDDLFNKRQQVINYTEALHKKDSKTGFSLFEMINNYLSIPQKELEIDISNVKNVGKDEILSFQNDINNIETIIKISGNPKNSKLLGLEPQGNDIFTFEQIKTTLHKFITTKDATDLLNQLKDILNFIDIRSIGSEELKEVKNDIEGFDNELQQINNKWIIHKLIAKQIYNNKYNKYAKIHIELFEKLKQRFQIYLDNFNDLKIWWQWINKKHEFKDNCLSEYFYYVQQTGNIDEETIYAFIKRVYFHKIMLQLEENEDLRAFNGLLFDEIINQYRNDVVCFQELTKHELYAKLASNIPSQTMEAISSSELGILKRNIMSSGRGNSIRSIIDKIPTLLPKLCPCMLMSPISVAQYLDINAEKFDLVIFDEASQMPTSEAIGAIARGKNLIVVGDTKQMPPTNFFTVSQTEEEDADIEDMESILDDCIALSMNEHYLSWHYRSKHESLIAFSNSQYYDNRLTTFPSIDDQERKVRLVEINGIYDKGKTRSNIDEAQAIVEQVIKRLMDENLRKYSIGIVSFSKVQQNLIEDLLNEQLSKDTELENLAYNCEEPIFVKNLENVQGDERDVILFSVGYGPDKDNKVSMNFGPLNNIGGERRLNVAVSRARYEMIVYSSLKAEMIDLNRTDSKGVAGLKSFLEFAKTGYMPKDLQNKTSVYNNIVINQIADKLEEEGYKTVKNIGRSDFKIDLAICDKNNTNKYILALLGDGNTYYNTPTARDREVVQRNVLSMLQWNVKRIWSVHYLTDRDNIMAEIHSKLNAINEGKIDEKQTTNAYTYKFDINNAIAKTLQSQIQDNIDKQNSFDKTNSVNIELYQTNIIKILQQQGNIPKQDLKKAVSKQVGYKRIGSNISNDIDKAIDDLIYQKRITITNDEKEIVSYNDIKK